MTTYELTTVTRNVPAIHCLLCDAVSPLLDDIAHRYCGRCHLFLEVVDLARQAHADGATHDCGEWRTARGVCAVCGVRLTRFMIYHWDTFDDTTEPIGTAETLVAAEHFVQARYGTRIADDGADRVDIVDAEGTVVKQYRVR